jgi:uncharacterized protein YhaN
MRLSTLALEKYGAFSGRSVTFTPGARLHLVFGANEAGKTTALAAITDLLFGIEERTAFNFEHANEDLRLGAEIVARDGASLAFRRRKGRKNTLIDGDDRALPDATLEPWLAGVTRSVFQHSFGLSQEGLRRGGEAMLAAEGEVGRSLFAAASGLTGLADLGRRLAGEAEIQFKRSSRGTTRFDKLRHDYEEARKAIRARSVSFEAWRDLTERIAGMRARLDAIRGDRERIGADRARLARVRRLAPVLTRIDLVDSRLAVFSDLPDLPDGFASEIRACLHATAEIEREERELAAALVATAARLAGIDRTPALIAQAGQVDALVERLQALREAARDQPKQEAACAEAAAGLDALARRLGLADAGALTAAEPTEAVRQRQRRLLTERMTLAAAAATLGRERETAEADVASAQAALAARAGPGVAVEAVHDPEPLRRRLAALRPDVEAIAGRLELAAALARRRALLAERAGRLAPAIADLADLARHPLPAADRLQAFAREAAELAEVATELATRRRALAAGLAAEQRAQVELMRSGELPTAETLQAARDARDRLWAMARAFVDPGPPPALDAVARRTLALDLDQAMTAADRLADRRDAESDRLARHAEITRRLAAAVTALDSLAAEEAALAGRREVHATRWHALWAELDLAPGAPGDMLMWLRSVAALIAEHDALNAEATQLTALAAREAALAPAVAAIAADLGLAVGALPAAVAMREIELAIADRADAWQAMRAARRDLARAQTALARVADAERRHAAEMERWQVAWRDSLPAIGLPGDAAADEAEAALAVWSQLPELRAKRDIARHRAEAMARMLAESRAEIAAVIAGVALDLSGAEPIAAVGALRDRLAGARAAEAQVREVVQERLRVESRLALVRERRAQSAAEQAALAARAGLADPGQLAALAQRLGERAAARAELLELRAALADAGDGLAEAAVRAELAAIPADTIAQRELALSAEDARMVDELGELSAAHTMAEGERQALAGGRGAELAAQDEAAAAAGLAEVARSYAVLEAARLIVTAAIERHRARYQDPLLARAAKLFARVTGGAFAGLALDYRDGDVLTLAAERPDGRRISIAGLSEGSRDQLYLALRLATLTEFASRADPLPFIGDDLLVSFDDNRAAHGLDALAEAGEALQVILFTHHAHVVELAQARLNGAVDVICL